MTYFIHTARDLHRAKQEIGDALIGILNDAALKLEDETRDRQLILEDLITRVTGVATGLGLADVTLYPAVQDANRITPAYALIGDAPTMNPAEMPPVVKASIRETHNLQEFEGVRRHAFSGVGSAGTCEAKVKGGNLACGLKPTHDIHDWWF